MRARHASRCRTLTHAPRAPRLRRAAPRRPRAQASRAVTPAVPLPAAEQAMVDVFERLTYSVVNVVDITVAQAGLSRPGAQARAPRRR